MLPEEEEVILDVKASFAMQGGGELENLERQIERYEAFRADYFGGYSALKSVSLVG